MISGGIEVNNVLKFAEYLKAKFGDDHEGS